MASTRNSIDWDDLKSSLRKGDLVEGVVIRHAPYGVYVDLGFRYDGLIQITDFKDVGVMNSAEYPVIGSRINAVVLGFKDYGRQIWLSVKPSILNLT